MLLQQKRNLVCGIGAYLLSGLIFFFILTGLYVWLIRYLSSDFLPRLAEDSGIEDFSCEIRRIGLSGADAGPLRIGRSGDTGISAGSLQIDYSLWELSKKHIRKISLNGMEFHFEFKDGKFRVRGFDPEAFLSRNRSENASDSPPSVSIGGFEVRNASLICQWGEKYFRLPFELDVVPENGNWDTLASTLRIYPRGQEMRFAVSAFLRRKKIHLEFEAQPLVLERFADFAGQIPGLVLSGKLNAGGNADFQTNPFALTSLSLFWEFHNEASALGNFRLKENTPISGELQTAENPGRLKIRVSSVPLKFPVPLLLSDINSHVKLTPDALEAGGNFKLGLENDLIKTEAHEKEAVPGNTYKIVAPLRAYGNFFADVRKTGEWEFGLTALDRSVSNPKYFELKTDTLNIVSKVPVLDISAKGGHGKGFADYGLGVSDIRVHTASAKIGISSASLRGRANFGGDFRTWATLKISGGGISASDFSAGGIQGNIPLKWPCKDAAAPGKFSAKKMKWGHMNLGSLRGGIRQKAADFVFQAKHRSRLIPGLVLNISGNGKNMDFSSSPYEIPGDIDLGKFAPSVRGIRVNGDLAIGGHVIFGEGGTRIAVNSELSRASLRFEEKDMSAEGIHLRFSMPDLPLIRSAPRQHLSFEKASLSGLTLTDGNMDFQLEQDGSFFIEKSSFRWCKGNVHFQALRISPEIEDYDVVLYCDRLDLAMILEQLGAGKAEGDGSLNGKIPVYFKEGKIIFDDAFLYSTPGEGGTIHVINTDILTAGIPPGTLEHTYVNLAREALRDFNYKWVTLRLSTRGEELEVKLKFDGKPAKPLPFVYKKEVGGFARVEAGTELSNFQGMRLDLNMKLPLDKMLKYRTIYDMME